MVASTRKRSAAAVIQPAAQATPKRVKAGSSPPAAAGSPPQARGLRGSPATTPGKQAGASVPKKGSRGAAFLAAAGIALPAADAPPKLSTKKESAVKSRRLDAQADAAATKPASPRRNQLLQQPLPRKLQALLDMFAGLQTVHEVMRKRGQRTTFQNIRQAVEEASGRRFLLSHVAQLKHLLPEALELEWVKLPVAAHTSRTEAHLLITLNGEAAGEAAASEGAAPRGGELQAARQLLHCRLAGHLLESYRGHLGSRAEEARQTGDAAAAADLEAACSAAERPPVTQWVEPYPEGAADVPQLALPPRPEAGTPSSRAASPVVLGGAAAAAAAGAAQLGVPGTPATSLKPQATTAGRTGRPPVYPNTVERHRLQQRRLSFSGADPLASAAAAAAAAARPSASGQRRVAGSSTPLDKLSHHLDSAAQQEREQQQQQAQQQAHPAQAALVASLADAGEFEFGGAERLVSQEDADLLASMPEHLRRMSTDGIISLDTLRKLEVAEQQHRRLSSKEAVAAREANAALSQLPRTFSRLQRIFGYQVGFFGYQGPNALKLRDVVLRIKQGAETTSEAQIEAQLRTLAQHAPEYLSLKPYGACGTPALWVNRSANANAVMARLKEAAEAGSRRSSMSGL